MATPKKLKNGKWSIRIRYKDAMLGEWKEKYHTAKTRQECKDFEVDFLGKAMRGENMKETTLLQFYDLWFETFKKGKVSPGREDKIMLVRRLLEKFFGEKQLLRNVTKVKYQKFVNWMGEAKPRGLGLSKTTVSNRHTIVRSMFLEAQDMQYITSNPSRNIKIYGQEAHRLSKKTATIEEIKKIKDTLLLLEDSTVKYFLLTQLHTGARYQEVAALTWNDIDEQKQVIVINKAYQAYNKNKRIGKTKSKAGNREIDVSSNLFQNLKRYKAYQNKLMLSNTLYNPRNLLFCAKDTFPVSNTLVNKKLKSICEQAGVDRMSTHSFRHAKTDLLILADTDPIYMKNQLGHEDAATSYKHYASMSEESKKKNNKKFQEFMRDIL